MSSAIIKTPPLHIYLEKCLLLKLKQKICWTVILVPRFLLVFFESLVLCDLFQKSCLKLRLTAIELNRKVGFPQHGGRIGEGEEICVSWRHQLSARALFEQTRQAMPMRRRNATAIHGSSHLCFISAAVGPPFLT
jgi:hypothetical protein